MFQDHVDRTWGTQTGETIGKQVATHKSSPRGPAPGMSWKITPLAGHHIKGTSAWHVRDNHTLSRPSYHATTAPPPPQRYKHMEIWNGDLSLQCFIYAAVPGPKAMAWPVWAKIAPAVRGGGRVGGHVYTRGLYTRVTMQPGTHVHTLSHFHKANPCVQ